jgi:circadian clock protein KaiB
MSKHANGFDQFERALAEQSKIYVLNLYVSGATPKSLEAIRNVKNVCDANFAGRYKLEIVDIFRHPDRAAIDQVLAVPTLVKQLPLPTRRLIGTLSNTRQVLQAFGLTNTEVDLATVAKDTDRG